MVAKSIMFFAIVAIAYCQGGVVPVAPAAYVANYATSYNAHVVNHAIAAPVAAPLVAAPASLAYSPYSAYPYAYSAPLVI